MPSQTGQLIFIIVVAMLLSFIGAWWTAYRYRVTMRRLMSAPAAAVPQAPAAAIDACELPPPAPTTLAENRRAGIRLSLLLIGMSCLMALSSASLWLVLSFPGKPFAIKRAAVLALMHLWPVIPALGLLWRWSTPRVLGALALWCVFCFGVTLWRSIEPRPLELVLALASDIGPPLVLVALLFMGSATRAVAPWLLLPFIGLVTASIAGLDLLGVLVARRSALVVWLASWLNAHIAMLLFALLPWLLAWWPLRLLGRALGRAYVRKRLSELMVMFTSVWTISLLLEALTVMSAIGLTGFAMLLPLAWIPIVMALDTRLRRNRGRRRCWCCACSSGCSG